MVFESGYTAEDFEFAMGPMMDGKYVGIENGTFTFGFDPLPPPPAVSIPSTMLLLGSGLIGLVGLRRKYLG